MAIRIKWSNSWSKLPLFENLWGVRTAKTSIDWPALTLPQPHMAHWGLDNSNSKTRWWKEDWELFVEILATDINCYHLIHESWSCCNKFHKYLERKIYVFNRQVISTVITLWNLWLCTWRLDVLNNGENQDMSFPYVQEFHKCRLGWYRVFLPLGATPSYHPLKKMDFPWSGPWR